ncbi:hypothetical protein [Chlorobium sp. N1]|uniref:hypothetical protein n=1 Tax=Chlorobium sp. N1 TaxID=2491138 RepID=UPI0013F17C7A|nr:hypothetical protein [Chlorobium sp. N1]
MADIIVERLFERERCSWGAGNRSAAGEARTAYIKAIRAADAGDYRLLSVFARS